MLSGHTQVGKKLNCEIAKFARDFLKLICTETNNFLYLILPNYKQFNPYRFKKVNNLLFPADIKIRPYNTMEVTHTELFSLTCHCLLLSDNFLHNPLPRKKRNNYTNESL